MTTREPINQMLGAENGETDEEDEKWITHYSSNHQILLVGEGDFSFSLSLANGFASASNICATSLDSYVVLKRKYKNAVSNLENLEKLGATLLHGVDATKMKYHVHLANRKFDRIIFNFPHAGFCGKEDNPHVIQKHKNLVQGFFWNARVMLRANGEIHINHKTGTPFCLWDLEKLASESSLVLFQCVDFNIEDYPGYHNKRGDGSRCDLPFPLGECSTFKFCLWPPAKKVGKATTRPRLSEKSWHFETVPMQQQPTSDFNYPQRNHIVNHFPPYVGLSEKSRHFETLGVGLSEKSRHFETIPMPMQLQPTSDFNYPQRNRIVNHIPPYVALGEKSRHFETTPMQVQPTSDFNYPQRSHIVNHIPPYVGLNEKFRYFETIPMQLQPTSDFNYPQRNHIVNQIPLHDGLSEKSRHFETVTMQLQPTSDFNYPQRNHILNHIPLHDGLSEKSRHFETIPMRLKPTSGFNSPQRNRIVDHMPLHVGLPPTIPNGNQYSEVFDRNLNGLFRTYEWNSYGVAYPERLGPDLDARYYGLGRVRHGLETLDRQMLEVFDRNLNGLFRTYERNSYGVAYPERLGPDLDARYYGIGRVRHGLETLDRQMLEAPRTLNGDLYYMHDHDHDHDHDQDQDQDQEQDQNQDQDQDHELHHISNS